MTDSNSVGKSLSGALANPNTIDQQTRARGFFLDEHTTSIPSEGNMLSLLTMRDLFKDNTQSSAAINAVAKEESKYLIKAMKLLTTNPEDGRTDNQKRTLQRMQDKFGRDFAGATNLSKLLKEESIRKDFEEAINEFVGVSTINKDSGALTTSENVGEAEDGDE